MNHRTEWKRNVNVLFNKNEGLCKHMEYLTALKHLMAIVQCCKLSYMTVWDCKPLYILLEEFIKITKNNIKEKG